jgi:hypothetical protein
MSGRKTKSVRPPAKSALRPKASKKKMCGGCGELGHNILTCPKPGVRDGRDT